MRTTYLPFFLSNFLLFNLPFLSRFGPNLPFFRLRSFDEPKWIPFILGCLFRLSFSLSDFTCLMFTIGESGNADNSFEVITCPTNCNGALSWDLGKGGGGVRNTASWLFIGPSVSLWNFATLFPAATGGSNCPPIVSISSSISFALRFSFNLWRSALSETGNLRGPVLNVNMGEFLGISSGNSGKPSKFSSPLFWFRLPLMLNLGVFLSWLDLIFLDSCFLEVFVLLLRNADSCWGSFLVNMFLFL